MFLQQFFSEFVRSKGRKGTSLLLTVIVKELPKVEEEVKNLIAEWERQQEKPFLVDGKRFVDYIEKQWTAYQNSKIVECFVLNGHKMQVFY
jgi:methyl coenzyme M reductase subunit C-like uncharacterized protein (methanogenesis marker protein 7)